MIFRNEFNNAHKIYNYYVYILYAILANYHYIQMPCLIELRIYVIANSINCLRL